MGGPNSGRRRTVHRGAIEQFPTIDLRVLKRAGLLRVGQCTHTTLNWRNQALEALSARIFVDLSDTGDGSMRIVVCGDDVPTTDRVAIDFVPCRYGGFRCYFLCPLIGVRCEQIFLADGIFASRKAHKLTYASQSEDEISRVRRKVRKLHRRVEGDFRYARPRGRNRWRRVRDLKAAKLEARALYHDRLRALVGDLQ